MRARSTLVSAFFAAASLGLGCGGSTMIAGTGDHDTPVAAEEPRAEMKLKIDLAAEQGCEEAFDLAIYKDRGVDLIQWDTAVGTCTGRVVVIRYLSKSLSAEALLSAVKSHAVKVEAINEK